jgi:hypothetical protein
MRPSLVELPPPRMSSLVVQEIQQLEQRIGRTPGGGSSAQLLLLARAYEELARIAATEPGRDAASRERVQSTGRTHAATHLREALARPDCPERDRALALLAHVLEASGQAAEARAEWARLVAEHPASAHAPAASIALGDAAWEANQLPSADRSYRRALASPTLSPPLRAWTLYRSGWVAYNVGTDAPLAFARAAAAARQAGLTSLAEAAQAGVVLALSAGAHTPGEIAAALRELGAGTAETDAIVDLAARRAAAQGDRDAVASLLATRSGAARCDAVRRVLATRACHQ